MKKELHNQRGELIKLNEEVDRADKHHMDSITAIKAKRKQCHSLVQVKSDGGGGGGDISYLFRTVIAIMLGGGPKDMQVYVICFTLKSNLSNDDYLIFQYVRARAKKKKFGNGAIGFHIL